MKMELQRFFIISSLILAIFLLLIFIYSFISSPTIADGYLADEVRKVSYNAPLTIHFSQAMDRQSVEENFSIQPKLAGIHSNDHSPPPRLQQGFHQQTACPLILSQHIAREEEQPGRSQVLFCQAIGRYAPRPRARIENSLAVAALEATEQ